MAFCFYDQSSSPAKACFSVKFVFEKNENKLKRGRGGPTITKHTTRFKDNMR